MRHLLSLRYTAGEEEAERHVAYLERHHREGAFLLFGQTVPAEEGGVVLAAGISRAEAERIAASDPLVTGGVAECTVTTVAPGRARPGLAAVLQDGAPHAHG